MHWAGLARLSTDKEFGIDVSHTTDGSIIAALNNNNEVVEDSNDEHSMTKELNEINSVYLYFCILFFFCCEMYLLHDTTDIMNYVIR